MDASDSDVDVDVPTVGPVHAVLDSIILTCGEGSKTLLTQSLQLAAQFVNGVSARVLEWWAPGYSRARRARIAVARAAGDLARVPGVTAFPALASMFTTMQQQLLPASEGGDAAPLAAHTRALPARITSIPPPPRGGMSPAAHLARAGEVIAHQDQPTSANRWSPGIVSEGQLFLLVFIDACTRAARARLANMCGASMPSVRRRSGPRVGRCCSCRWVRSVMPPDVLQAPPILMQSTRKRTDAPLPRISVPVASPVEEDDTPRTPSHAYWPLPALSSTSAACRIIDSICGFPVQTYAVRTVDGYVLTLIRIPRVESRKAVLFQHGLLDSASAWVSTGSVHSLAARAYAAGFDVFLGNLRGSNDALGINGLGANPVDYADVMAAEDDGLAASIGGTAAAQETKFQSPPRGGRQRVNSIDAPVRDTPSSRVHVIGTSQDGVPVHETLHPRQREYWNFAAQDHALDVMAFLRQIRIIKALERRARERARGREKNDSDTQGGPSRNSSHSPRSGASSSGHDRPIDATSTDADDVRIVAVGHSMGGCVLLMYLLVARALRRPTFLHRVVLLSPAGLHNAVGWLPWTVLMAIYYTGLIESPGPFPQRSSSLQRFAARLLQDVKNSTATGDLMAVLAAYVFGGIRERFVFRFVAISQYPIGGTCTKVIRHGIQAMKARDFCAYSYTEEENLVRYRSRVPPSYRHDYALFDIPMDFVAGGRDMLVPPRNTEEQFAVIDAVSPGIATLHTFPDAGHLDFSLTLSDDIISYVLQRIEQGVAVPAEGATVAGMSPDTSQLLDAYGLRALVAEARARRPGIASLVESGWKPARECALDFPWLGGFSKQDVVMDGLDTEAHEMGLVGAALHEE